MSYLDNRNPDEMITKRAERSEVEKRINEANAKAMGGITILATKGDRTTKHSPSPEQVQHETSMAAQKARADQDVFAE
jgi:hypothetical protein